ncbi:hypothetical protein AVEN_207917-1 [Araneus ventricosus]|uniref:Uncharacterized protein n=1 Tax=Araneus ventricosus TaxID=182803 RepID=A0A4Y2W7R9_ARAVE|nr:hypothetical protein AVEN_262769-1 [Araneus ventricosus]GBO32181.1 hypothetical protein AVEN_207917-1 [Araneus ventricosus]
MTSTGGFSSKRKHTIQYPNIPSAVRPVPHNESFPIPVPPKTYTLQPKMDLEDFEPQPGPSTSTDDDEEYPAVLIHRQPHLVTQPELIDVFWDLELPKSESQLLGSRLQQWNLRKGRKNLILQDKTVNPEITFSEDEGLVFYLNSNELMIELKMPCDPHKWRLLIDSSKTSLKVVLLANGNDLPSVLVAYSVDMKETCENISRILDKICYHDYNWKPCSDLKVVALLTGLQTDYTKC